MAFVTGGLVGSSSAPALRTVCNASQSKLRMAASAADVVNAAYPKNIKNKAPVISFDGKKGVKLEMVTLQTFAGDDSEDTLFDYSSGKFMPQKPADMGIAWPSGDGRQAEMKGGKGSFNQPDLRKYGPFPDFLKRSMDL